MCMTMNTANEAAMITADTITDEQIRELRDIAVDHAVTLVCRRALSNQIPQNFDTKRNARGECAAILNEAYAAATDDDADKVWRIGSSAEDPDVMHVGAVAKNAHGDFSLVEQAFARARCAEILNERNAQKEG